MDTFVSSTQIFWQKLIKFSGSNFHFMRETPLQLYRAPFVEFPLYRLPIISVYARESTAHIMSLTIRSIGEA